MESAIFSYHKRGDHFRLIFLLRARLGRRPDYNRHPAGDPDLPRTQLRRPSRSRSRFEAFREVSRLVLLFCIVCPWGGRGQCCEGLWRLGAGPLETDVGSLPRREASGWGSESFDCSASGIELWGECQFKATEVPALDLIPPQDTLIRYLIHSLLHGLLYLPNSLLDTDILRQEPDNI